VSDHERLAALFERARDLPPPDAEALIAGLTGEDRALADDLRELLGHHRAQHGGLDAPIEWPAWSDLSEPQDAPAAPPPERIGAFTLLGKLGEGGMGVVYLAEQDRPRRRVALKLVRPDVAAPAALRRFEREAELLARLQHRGIAQVLAAGAVTVDGRERPYFALELVDGQTLTEHARELDLRARVELLCEVCAAVEHAHERGVVHRDLKPSNVLVDAQGQPKVLDFGIARAVDADGRATLVTRTGELLGTLAYMAPEQLDGAATADARTDVYALGVIAYELLSGELPLDVRSLTVAAAARVVAEDEPRPLGRVRAELKGDLETIVAKALAKEPSERYPSARALADDLGRHLEDRTILARRATGWDHARRFARRNPALAGAYLALLAASVTAAAVSTRFWLDARAARAAETERAEAAERSAYVASLGAAARALDGYALGAARRWLDEVPASLREGFEARYYAARLDDSVRVLVPPAPDGAEGRERPVNAVAAAPRGARIAAGGSDGVPRVWDAATGELVRELTAHPGGILDLVFDRAGEHLYTGGNDGLVVRHDLATGAKIAEVALSSVPTSLAVSPSGDPAGALLAAGCEDGSIVLLVASLEAEPATLARHGAVVWGLAFDPTGARLASASDDGTARVFDVAARAEIAVFRGHAEAVKDVRFVAGGTRVASCSVDKTLRIWDPAGAVEPVVMHAPTRLDALAVLPDGERVLAGAGGGALHVFAPAESLLAVTLAGHAGTIRGIAVAADGVRIASGADDGSVRIWDALSTDRPDVLPLGGGAIMDLALTADGGLAAVVTLEGHVGIWDVASGALRAKRDDLGRPPLAVAFSSDERFLVVGHADGRLLVIDARSGEIAEELRPGRGGIRDVAVHGSRVACAGPDGAVVVLERGGWTEVARTPEHPKGAYAVAFDPSGERLLTGGGDGTVRLVDARTGAVLAEQRDHAGPARWVGFAPGGGRAASCSYDGTARVLDAATLAPLGPPLQHDGPVHRAAFAPDGSRLAVGNNEGAVWIWDVEHGAALAQLEAGYAPVSGLAFTSGGDDLVVGGRGEVRLFTTRSLGALARERREAAGASPHDP
jgi:WD40 repeat protein